MVPVELKAGRTRSAGYCQVRPEDHREISSGCPSLRIGDTAPLPQSSLRPSALTTCESRVAPPTAQLSSILRNAQLGGSLASGVCQAAVGASGSEYGVTTGEMSAVVVSERAVSLICSSCTSSVGTTYANSKLETEI